MAAPVARSPPPNVEANTMAKITKAPSTTAPVSTHTLETEEKTALSKQWHVQRVLGKLIVAQMDNKYPAFYKIRRFIIVFTTARYGILS
jgi:hypothetical protein